MNFIKANEIVNNYADEIKTYNKATVDKAINIVSDFFKSPDLLTYYLSDVDLYTDELNRALKG